ncbi:hypothetical protein GLYMA_10G141200v4 [Glycine max]|uniref:Uncharacterized protein n=2 Tax=Glycine subgen. Soja TaxID=1462606 RepID=A0A0R0I1Y3_SOYBN|nr:hypothetical protein GLYMA_10G141200v4 [Glycine max]
MPPSRKANERIPLLWLGSVQLGCELCGKTLLISLEGLVEDGLLEKHELPQPMLQIG